MLNICIVPLYYRTISYLYVFLIQFALFSDFCCRFYAALAIMNTLYFLSLLLLTQTILAASWGQVSSLTWNTPRSQFLRLHLVNNTLTGQVLDSSNRAHLYSFDKDTLNNPSLVFSDYTIDNNAFNTVWNGYSILECGYHPNSVINILPSFVKLSFMFIYFRPECVCLTKIRSI